MTEKILVTGGCGYIGSILVRMLLKENYNVVVLDNLSFGKATLNDIKNKNFSLIEGDIRNDKDIEQAIRGVDAVVHLAALVGDPQCAAKPKNAMSSNFDGTIRLVKICKQNGIKKFIYTSTCSVYGCKEEELLIEESKLNPVSLYAWTKLYSERALLALADSNFKPLILRLATVYGKADRTRFDLVVNLLTKKAVTEKKIVLFGADQWRPFIHVEDVARAVLLCLKKYKGEAIFNVGSTRENYQIRDLGFFIKEVIPAVNIEVMQNPTDKRDYRVSFEKIEKELGFKNTKTVKEGIIEIKDMCENDPHVGENQTLY